MGKTQQIQKEMMAALKAKDTKRKDALSLMLSTLKAKAKDERRDLTEEEENALILKEIKQTKETRDSAPADRKDIIEECEFRIAVLSEFAPNVKRGDFANGPSGIGAAWNCGTYCKRKRHDYENLNALSKRKSGWKTGQSGCRRSSKQITKTPSFGGVFFYPILSFFRMIPDFFLTFRFPFVLQ